MPTVALMRKLDHLDPRLREVFLLLIEELEQQVTKTEFNELKAIVADLTENRLARLENAVIALAEAQKRTEQRIGELTEAQQRAEQRLTRLEDSIAELVEWQKRTEQRLTRLEESVAELVEWQKRTEGRLERLESIVAELAEAQKRAEQRLTRLEKSVAELVEWQKRTEQRINELTEAQQRTEQRLERLESIVTELAEAQKRTEEELHQLAAAHRVTRERLEGLSDTVGYTLEDRAFRSLPNLLRQHGVEVEGRLVRRYVRVRGRERQVNIYGHGRRGETPVLILGEAKVRPSRREIDRFLRLVKQLEDQEGREAVPLFVAYDFPPRIEAYLREHEVLPVWSYDLAL